MVWTMNFAFDRRLASNNLPEARGLAGDHTNVETMSLDVSDQQSLAEAVKNVDVVVRSVPTKAIGVGVDT